MLPLPVFAVLGGIGASTCSSSFCIWTVRYLIDNSEQLFSGIGGFFTTFPWGWLVAFCEDTYQLEDGTHSPLPSLNLSMTYFIFLILAVFLHREARRLKMTTPLALCTLAGTFLCLCAFIPGVFLVMRALKLKDADPGVDERPLDIGTMGAKIPILNVLTVVGCIALWVAGGYGGNEAVYGLAFSFVGVATPLAYAFIVYKDDETTDVVPPAMFKKWLAFCAVVTAAAYVSWLILTITLGENLLVGFTSLATMVFQADFLVLRTTMAAVIFEDGKPGLALFEFVAGPFGFLAWLWGRASAEEADARTTELMG